MIKKTHTPFRKLLDNIGTNLIADFCISCISGVAGSLLSSLDLILGIFRLSNSAPKFLANTLYGCGRNYLYRKEIIRLDLEWVRCAKRKALYTDALNRLENVLKTAPASSEALFLKAQILHEGFGDATAARKTLWKLIRINKDRDDLYFRWACNFYDDLSPPGRERGGK
jgi:tetratricopeptide (TPR) repeat protein